ncbi:MAG: phytanoyl-CoA dioxygenase family protein, partial [Egibacteraceae bacterium]
MTAIHPRSGPLTDAERATLVFGGGLVVFGDVPGLAAFRDVADGMIRQAFGADPERAHAELAAAELSRRAAELQRGFRRHDEAAATFREVLADVGADIARTCWDWLYLRVLPPHDRSVGDRLGGIGFHRDTWSSNVLAQTNWWTPLYAITEERSLAFYPRYWSAPIANTSGSWDLEQREGRPLVPEPAQRVDARGELRMVVEPGDLLCFSGAQLHASVPNTSGLTRFSVEVRTVNLDDVAAGRGAPNVDGRAPRVAWR